MLKHQHSCIIDLYSIFCEALFKISRETWLTKLSLKFHCLIMKVFTMKQQDRHIFENTINFWNIFDVAENCGGVIMKVLY